MAFTNSLQINIEKLAGLAGYTKGSAGVIMGNIKRKLKVHAASIQGNGNGATVTPAGTPKKPTAPKTPKSSGKKRNAAAPNNDQSPTKKGKKAGGNKARAESNDDDDDGEFTDVRVKKEEAGELVRGLHDYLGEEGYGAYEERDGDVI